MAKAIQHSPENSAEAEIKVPPMVPGGTYVVEDLGRFVNWITRIKHTRREVEKEAAESGLYMTEEEWEAQGGDPDPVEPPPPVPGGDDAGTRGGKPSDFETK